MSGILALEQYKRNYKLATSRERARVPIPCLEHYAASPQPQWLKDGEVHIYQQQ